MEKIYRMDSKIVYLPGLNGLRAIAAIAVVVSHITHSLNLFNLDPFIFGSYYDGVPRGLDLAGHGVSIFFCLSGFLITYLLQLEQKKHSINVRKFYIRRILRIWPLYYLYLAISVLAIFAWGFDLNLKSLFLYIFFMANAPFLINLPFLAHYWSIGVEEQFYIFWPWLNKKAYSNIIIYTTLLILILICLKLILHFIYPNSIIEPIIHVSRFHCMLIGALGALLYFQKQPLFLKIVDNKIAQLFAWFIIFLVMINKFHIASILDTEIISIVALFIIIGQINIKNRMINLEIPVFDFLGKISYGIYIIHPIIIFIFSKFMADLQINDILKYIIIYCLITCTTILLAYLSYEYYEKAFIKLKIKYSTIISSGTKEYENEK